MQEMGIYSVSVCSGNVLHEETIVELGNTAVGSNGNDQLIPNLVDARVVNVPTVKP